MKKLISLSILVTIIIAGLLMFVTYSYFSDNNYTVVNMEGVQYESISTTLTLREDRVYLNISGYIYRKGDNSSEVKLPRIDICDLDIECVVEVSENTDRFSLIADITGIQEEEQIKPTVFYRYMTYEDSGGMQMKADHNSRLEFNGYNYLIVSDEGLLTLRKVKTK